MKINISKITAVCLLLTAVCCAIADNSRGNIRNIITELKPVGFWLADEGKGQYLPDRSGKGNHAKIYHTDWKEGLLDFTGAYQWLEISGHSSYNTEEFTISLWVFTRRVDYKRDGVLLFGNTRGWWKGEAREFGIVLREGGKIEIISGGKRDALGSLDDEVITANSWHHIAYSYSGGNGTLFVDGKQAKRAANVGFEADGKSFLIGNDASWWMLHPPGSQSLEGAIGHIAIFDRQLCEQEITRLFGEAKPSEQPIAVEEQAKSSLSAEDTLRRFIEALEDEQTSTEKRIEAALAAVDVKLSSKDVADRLATHLEDMLRQGAYMPRVEDVCRNAIIKLLLDMDRYDARIRDILGEAIAKPALDFIDTSRPELDKVRLLIERRRYLDALQVYKDLPVENRQGRFFSEGDARRDARGRWGNERAYTPTSSFNGSNYTVGSGQPWEGAHRISRQEFQEAVEQIAKQYPEAKNWQPIDVANVFRVQIKQTDPSGNEKTVLLEGDWFILDGTDEKNRGWSICVDKEGFLHLFGGQHNSPRPEAYIPGSWERLGLSRERGDENFPTVLYWVSEKPGDITTFKFAGKKDNPRIGQLPDYFNYMNFSRDNNGELYVYGRINVSGIQSWGLYHYDTEARSWKAIGGYSCDVISDGERAFPDWRKALISQFRGSVPTTPTEPAIVWAWQPHFYNYCRSTRWGVVFDRTNRMHVRVPIRGLDENIRIADSEVYAYSDDGGKTFRRADGAPLRLPLTVNPAPAHNADVEKDFTEKIWNLWQNMLKYAGY